MNDYNFDPGDDLNDLEQLKEETRKALENFFDYMQKKEKNHIDYMEKEGFIEKTNIPGMFKYTPEGLALMQEQYKQFKKNGY